MIAREWLLSRDNPCSVFHYWRVLPPHNDQWTPFMFEKNVCSKPLVLVKASNENQMEESSTTTVTIVKPQHPHDVICSNWTSRLVWDWIQFVCAKSGIAKEAKEIVTETKEIVTETTEAIETDCQHLILKEITHFRRIGMECLFEFLCTWQTPHGTARTWQKLSHLMSVKVYWDYVCERWNVHSEKEKHFEEEQRLCDDEMLVTPWREQDGYSNWDPCKAYQRTEEELRLEKKHKAVCKAQKRKKNAKKKRTTKRKFSDEDDEENENDLSTSESEYDEEDDEDETSKIVLKSQTTEDTPPIPWEPIFNFTSGDIAPHFRVKVFPKELR